MRTRNMFIDDFNDITKLYRYLYSNKCHTICIKNAIDVPLELSMDENGIIFARNMNFPESDPFEFADLSIPNLLAIIEQLKDQPAAMKTQEHLSRWDEIKWNVAYAMQIAANGRMVSAQYTE